MNLASKHILITGATGGIGRALATQLAAAGAELLLVARDGQALSELESQLAGRGHRTLALDLLAVDAIDELLSVARQYELDGVINIAGANQLAMLETMRSQDLARLVQINLMVPMQICRALLPLLGVKPGTFIVNVGSILGSIGYAGSTVYCASKFGLRGFTEALQREVADSGLRVIYFAPRATDTALNSEAIRAMNAELKTAVDTPEKVASELVHALTYSRKNRIYLGWPEKFFVRLNSLLPNLVDNALVKQLPIIRRHAKTNEVGSAEKAKQVKSAESAESSAASVAQ